MGLWPGRGGKQDGGGEERALFFLSWLVTAPNLLTMSPKPCALQGPVFMWATSPGIHHQSQSLPGCPKPHKCHPDPILFLFPVHGMWAGNCQGCRKGICAWILLFLGIGDKILMVQPENFPWCLHHADFLIPITLPSPWISTLPGETPAGAALLTAKVVFSSGRQCFQSNPAREGEGKGESCHWSFFWQSENIPVSTHLEGKASISHLGAICTLTFLLFHIIRQL